MIYFDTSALIKLYLREEHSERVNALLVGQDDALPVWSLHLLELRNTFCLKLFRNELTQGEVDGLVKLFHDRLQAGFYAAPALDCMDLTATALQLTSHTRRLGCRSLDILHVAAALRLSVPRFITFDDRQRQLAEAAGLNVAL